VAWTLGCCHRPRRSRRVWKGLEGAGEGEWSAATTSSSRSSSSSNTYLRAHLLPSSKKLEVRPTLGRTKADAKRGRRQRGRRRRRHDCNMADDDDDDDGGARVQGRRVGEGVKEGQENLSLRPRLCYMIKGNHV